MAAVKGNPLSLFKAASALGLLAALAAAASAQTALMAENAGRILPVVRAHGFRACVRVNGEVVLADGKGLVLGPAAEYLPVLVSLQDIKAGATFSSVSLGNAPMDKSTFGFSAKLVSPFLLKDVFLVL